MNAYFLALTSVLFSVAAQFALKRGAVELYPSAPSSEVAVLFTTLLKPWVIVGLGLYAASALVWISVLSRWDVSKAYPLVGFGFIVTLLVGAFLGESIGWYRITGVVLISIGVCLVGAS